MSFNPKAIKYGAPKQKDTNETTTEMAHDTDTAVAQEKAKLDALRELARQQAISRGVQLNRHRDEQVEDELESVAHDTALNVAQMSKVVEQVDDKMVGSYEAQIEAPASPDEAQVKQEAKPKAKSTKKQKSKKKNTHELSF